MRRPSFRETVKCVSSVSTLTTEIDDLDAKVFRPFLYDRQFWAYVNQSVYNYPISTHKANILSFIFFSKSAGYPIWAKALMPPAWVTSGVAKTRGFSSPSVPVRANCMVSAFNVSAVGSGSVLSHWSCL